MALRKYQSVEKSKVVSAEGHKTINDGLRKAGKTSVKEMTPEEKKASGVDRAE